MKEGAEARRAVAEAGRRTVARRELARHARFDEVSPALGRLDEDAFDSLLDDDPDAALALLADLNGATDERLRALARRLSARVVVDVARGGEVRGGVGRVQTAPMDRAIGDLDVDASLDPIVHARLAGAAPAPAELRVRTWRRPTTAVCLLVDRSGSMHGERLAGAAVTAAAVALRAGTDASVVAFSGDAVVLSAHGEQRPPDQVVADLCRLRGAGVTDVGLALRVAADQLGRSAASRRVAILLSDCRVTNGGDPTEDAAALHELIVLAPAEDHDEAEAFARAVGARWAALPGPSAAPEVLRELLR